MSIHGVKRQLCAQLVDKAVDLLELCSCMDLSDSLNPVFACVPVC